jgi:glutathione synthase/RimK-type ligase-like ATP-grasp enzyme
MEPTVALVTARSAREIDADLAPLTTALRGCGIEPAVTVWDDAAVDWRRFRRVVIRSTWDYAARRGAFLAWAGRVAAHTALHNPLAVLRWSTDKRYLVDLAAAGVAVVPTTWCMPGTAPTFPGRPFVVKPSIGAGSVGAARFAAGGAAAAAHVARLHAAGHVAMIQPYLAEVERRGETAMVFFAGAFSHAIRKSAILIPGAPVFEALAPEQIVPVAPSEPELALARAALAAVPGRGPLLYARVDVVPGDDGAPRVLELELCEPSVYLDHAEGAADRFAAAIAALT